ncbi:toll-like receptor 6, partial [Pollicipes pollicipes]|uniref:toll-like receptor 6 n=1 Tax=Pollicipes pollicipes TaxID=41117 RepID=UPI001884E8C1
MSRVLSPRTSVASARSLLVIGCLLLAGYQCFTLLQLYLSEPVSMSLSFTPGKEVAVPSVTICGFPYDRVAKAHRRPQNVSIAEGYWQASVNLGRQVKRCFPSCRPDQNIPYPGGKTPVKTGSWSSWVATVEHALCHTFTPNVTWGQLVDLSSSKKFQLNIEISVKANRATTWDHRVLIHPKRRPLLTNLDIKGVQEDPRFELKGPNIMRLQVSSRIHDRESLQRARCNSSAGYGYEACVVQCYHTLWANTLNCSTPEMLDDFLHLPECSFRQLGKRSVFARGFRGCHCLPACRQQRYVVDATVQKLPEGMFSSTLIRVQLGQIPEEVATERRSYPPASLISEMGGYISLLLGVSVLSVGDVLSQIMSKRAAAEPCEPRGADAARCRLDTLDAGRVNVTQLGRLRRLEIECADSSHVSVDFAVALGRAFGELRELAVERCALGHLRRGVFRHLRGLRTLSLRTFNREWTSAEMRLERGCFEGLEYLETLDLGENNMWALESGVFADLASLKTLNLTGNSFQELAELQDAGISDSLQVLDVSSNGLLELSPAGLSSFGSLRELHARANHLAVIHDGALRDLKRLEVLDVSDNRLVALPAMMLNETRLLRDLRVQNNSIRVLPPSLLSDLPQLQAVNMSRNNLSSEWIRKDTFAGLFRLIVLDLSANQLDSLSVDVFHDLSSLQVLDLSRNVLTSVPDGVFSSLSNLHTLSLSDNALARLGRYSLAGLHVLSRLRLDNNRLTDIADLTFSNVTSVEHLLLQRNQLLSVPAALRRLTFLSRLDLADNFIRDVPVGALAPLRQLSFISLAGNQLSNVSVGCLTGLSSLAVLDLSRNRISGVESGAFDAAAGLRVVRIDANRLSNVNGLFAKLPALLWLNASDNQIEFFDYALIPVELRWLDLHNNRIRKIGNFYNIESKIKLETLDLSHNEVSHLAAASVPDGIKYFILASNQLTTVELGTFEAKSRLIRADFSSNQLSELDLQAVTLAGSEDSVAPAELLLAGNPFFCDCAMDWLLTIDTMTPRHKYPQVLDAERVMCRLLRSPGHPIPLPLTKPADFLCNYERHCFALCHCCNYVACDCEMKCPDGCSCYHDHTWNTNIVDCSSREQLAISREIPMDATALLAAGNNIRSLESHTFIGRKRIRLLYVNNSNVEEIQNRSLNGLSALQVLRLENN